MNTLSREPSTGNAVGAAQVIGEDNAFKFLVLPMGKHGERI